MLASASGPDPGRSYHAMQQRFARGEPPAVFGGQREAAIECAGGQPGDVRRQHGVGQGEQCIGGIGWLLDRAAEADTTAPRWTKQL